MRHAVLLLWICGLFALTGESGFGQPIIRVFNSLDQQVVDADVIVKGKVAAVGLAPGVSPKWDLQVTTLEPDEVLKGIAPKRLKFVTVPTSLAFDAHPGADPAWLKPGLEVLVFLRKSSDSRCFVSPFFKYNWLTAYQFVQVNAFEPNSSIYNLSDPKGLKVYDSAGKVVERQSVLGLIRAETQKTAGKHFRVKYLNGPQMNSQVAIPEELPYRQYSWTYPLVRLTPSAEFDGSNVLFGSGDDAFLCDAGTGAMLQKFVGSKDLIDSVAMSGDAQRVLTGSGPKDRGYAPGADTKVRLWNVEKGTVEREYGDNPGPVERLDFLLGSDFFCDCTTSLGNSLGGYQSHSSQKLIEDYSSLTMFVFPGDSFQTNLSQTMAVSSDRNSGAFAVWDLTNLSQLFRHEFSEDTLDEDSFTSFDFSPFGNLLLTTSSGGTKIRDAVSGNLVGTVPDPFRVSAIKDGKGRLRATFRYSKAKAAVYSKDGETIVTGSTDNVVRIYAAANLSLLRTATCPGPVLRLYAGPDGKSCLALWGDRESKGVSLIDIGSGKELLRTTNDQEQVVGYSEDGKTIFGFVGKGRHQGRVWDCRTGSLLRTIELRRE